MDKEMLLMSLKSDLRLARQEVGLSLIEIAYALLEELEPEELQLLAKAITQ